MGIGVSKTPYDMSEKQLINAIKKVPLYGKNNKIEHDIEHENYIRLSHNLPEHAGEGCYQGPRASER